MCHSPWARAALSLSTVAGIVMASVGQPAMAIAEPSTEKSRVVMGKASKGADVSTRSRAVDQLPLGDLPGWRQVFLEDFAEPAPRGEFLEIYKDRWGAYKEGWKDTSGNGTYSPSRVLSVKDGNLDFLLHSEDTKSFVAAPFPKIPDAAKRYGRYSVRFRADAVEGYKVAWLLWPESDAWSEGEIDFPEGRLTRTIKGYSHCVDRPRDNCLGIDTGASFQEWHVATTEWTAGRVTFYLDGLQVGTTTRSVPSTPMRWVLQTETRVAADAPDTDARGHVEVDWVAAWARD